MTKEEWEEKEAARKRTEGRFPLKNGLVFDPMAVVGAVPIVRVVLESSVADGVSVKATVKRDFMALDTAAFEVIAKAGFEFELGDKPLSREISNGLARAILRINELIDAASPLAELAMGVGKTETWAALRDAKAEGRPID